MLGPMDLPLADIAVPEPDRSLEPAGYLVTDDDGERLQFLDWDVPAGRPDRPGVLLIHGLAQTAWSWAPVARRIGGPTGPARVVAMDLRGHGLSDAPTEDDAYALDALAAGVVAVAEGSGLLVATDDRIVVAGHGFGASVAAHAAIALGGRCAGVVLVDGGWESLETATGLDAEEFLRGIAEPPEVMRSMTAFLEDRQGFDPATWDADQERAARATVVETHAGRVVPATRPHALEACVRAMFGDDPRATLSAVDAPVVALVAADDDARSRARALDMASAARVAASRPAIRSTTFPHAGHNLMRYEPGAVAAVVLLAARG
jgi:pimeloyl-ACP methyl ester carboxylesterase